MRNNVINAALLLIFSGLVSQAIASKPLQEEIQRIVAKSLLIDSANPNNNVHTVTCSSTTDGNNTDTVNTVVIDNAIRDTNNTNNQGNYNYTYTYNGNGR